MISVKLTICKNVFKPLFVTWMAIMFSTAGYTQGKLIWSDEFDTDGVPDIEKWDYERGYIRNNELQYYTDRSENVRVENGFLIIEARHDSLREKGQTFPVTSASLITKGKAEWTYVNVAVRAKIPSSLGTWPAIWMLGSNIDSIGWPECGEIDIMEHVGFDPHVIHTNIHTEAYNHTIGTNKGKATQVQSPYDDFHVYEIDWKEDRIDFYIDKSRVFTFTNDGDTYETWPFDQPFYLILNLAIGGSWGGAEGVSLESLPRQMVVDYVRVYKD